MKRNTVIDLLSLLSGEEVTKLGKFLRSPYFNSSKPVIALFDCLRKWHPDYEEKRIRPQIFWKKIYPGEAFAEQKYWTLNFNLRCLIERFMAVEEMQKDEFVFKKQLIQSHGRRNAHALFEKETKALAGQIEKLPYQDILSYSKSLWLKHDYYYKTGTNKYGGGASFSVKDTMHDLDRFYVLAKLFYTSEFKNREEVFSTKTNILLLDECVSLSAGFQEENPAFLMCRTILNLFDKDNPNTAFQTGKKLLLQHAATLSREVQGVVYANLKNFAIRQLNQGKTEYWNEVHTLNKMGLKLDLILHKDRITESAFLNMIHAGCHEKEFNWVKHFIEDYEKFLDPTYKEDIKKLSLGILYFEMKAYEMALSFVDDSGIVNVFVQNNAKILSIKIWFEKFIQDNSLFELLHSMLEANEKFFRRNKLLSKQKAMESINFILAIKQIVDMIFRKKGKMEIKEKMETFLAKHKTMVSKKWLIEKCNEL